MGCLNCGTENETRYSVDWFESNADYYGSNIQPLLPIIGITVIVYFLYTGYASYSPSEINDVNSRYVANGTYYNFHTPANYQLGDG